MSSRRILTTAINEDDGTAPFDLAMSVAGTFELEHDKAKGIAARVGKAVSSLRNAAARHGIGKAEIDRVGVRALRPQRHWENSFVYRLFTGSRRKA